MRAIALVVLLCVSMPAFSLAVGQSPACPEDDSGAYFTGKTRTGATGKHMKQYKCYLFGHLFWVASR